MHLYNILFLINISAILAQKLLERVEGSGNAPAPASIRIVDDEDISDKGSGHIPIGSGYKDHSMYKVPSSIKSPSSPRPTQITVIPQTYVGINTTTTAKSSILSHTFIYRYTSESISPVRITKKLDLKTLIKTQPPTKATKLTTLYATYLNGAIDKSSYYTSTLRPYSFKTHTPLIPKITKYIYSNDNISNEIGSLIGTKDLMIKKTLFSRPEILATAIGGVCITLLCAILLILFIIYRLRKKDEGSYALDETKRALSHHHAHTSNTYALPGGPNSPYSRGGRGPPPIKNSLINKEFYA
ncbi:uncharacterized protein LOC135931433 isoform X2 [Gordionus sp. m RMFG-2023]|uniref:uncharacterized protein LOC135931433 isoform X2 n=1 Tax=Gordionus sp. m RMFG-2023 TaxID=3053472 RepID=UPI0031FCA58F